MTATRTAADPLHAADRVQWRAWLRANCESTDEVWLVIQHVHRGSAAGGAGEVSGNSASPSVRHGEAVEEALCFGWIDSQARKNDGGSWCQRFTPRNPRGAWSKVNRDLVERLAAEGLMTRHGQAAVDLAKRSGTWSMLADAQDGVVPDDLGEQLAAVDGAAGHFGAFSRSTRRAILEWIARARRPETRQRRIARTVDNAARGERPRAPHVA